MPTDGDGRHGEPGLIARRGDGDGVLHFDRSALEASGRTVTARLIDTRIRCEVLLVFTLDADTGVLESRTELVNTGDTDLHVDRLMSVCLPLPRWARAILCASGDWSREGRLSAFPAPPGQWRQANRTGRTGFSGASFGLLSQPDADAPGEAIFVHLAWSGDHLLIVETLPSGERSALAGAALSPGEAVLPPGGRLVSPSAFLCYSPEGLQGVSDRFHPFVRARLPGQSGAVRKIHFNTWEAVYFDLDEQRLMHLAEAAASLGAERFVLDDGWFLNRRSDRSGLGDWRPDPGLFAEGLGPLIKRVRDLGMDFGLWVEPEMVSPDSAIYRERPDWCVHARGLPRPLMRSQLWLDMSREDVRRHVVTTLDALLSENDIAYLKWDCNRTIFPAVQSGRPGSGDIVRGAYEVMARIRELHPHVEIESCASGGARADLGVLRFARRIWASDSTDPAERMRIQDAASLVFPLETIGAHVSASPAPVTGRSAPIGFRARIAMFGHMGLEADPSRLTGEECEELRVHFADYRRWRGLLHSGRLLRSLTADGARITTVVSQDRNEALVLAARAEPAAVPASAPVRIPGLDRTARYLTRLQRPWPAHAARRMRDPNAWEDGQVFTGAALSETGLSLPLSDAMTAWLIHLTRVQH